KGISDFTWPSGGERKGDCGLYNYLYNSPMKVLNFRGSALTDLRAFPESARREAGYQRQGAARPRALRLETHAHGREGRAGNPGLGRSGRVSGALRRQVCQSEEHTSELQS